jgi:hypothetical protein
MKHAWRRRRSKGTRRRGNAYWVVMEKAEAR